jgi:hypothetical protein
LLFFEAGLPVLVEHSRSLDEFGVRASL